MRPVLIIATLFSICVAAFIFLKFGSISPVADISGCYVARFDGAADAICLAPPNRFEQSFASDQKNFVSYNESSMRTFKYTNDEGEFWAATLSDFVIVDTKGRRVGIKTFEIQPHRSNFGDVSFLIGKGVAKEDRVYIRKKL